MTTLPLRKRRRESSNESNERWKSSGKESAPVSKHHRASPVSWTIGQGQRTRREGRHLIHVSQKSTPSLLSRMKTSGQSPERLPLSKRIFPPSGSHAERGFKKRPRSSSTKYYLPERNLRERRSSSVLLERGRRKRICLGTSQPPARPEEGAALRHARSSSDSAKIYLESNHSYELPINSLKESPPPNGIEFSEVNPSISTRSSPPCTLSSLMRRERVAWEELRSFSPWQSQSDKSGQEVNGLQHTGGCQRQSSFFSPTTGRNYQSTLNTSKAFSLRNTQTPIPKSSFTTSQSAIELEEVRMSYSLTTNSSMASARQYCTPMELSTEEVERGRQREVKDQPKEAHPRRRLAEGSTVRMDASSQKKNASTSTPAQSVESRDTAKHPAPQRNINGVTDGMRPKYLCYNIWDPDSDFSPSVSDWTLTAEPLEGPPQSALDDEIVTKTLLENPHLFKIVTPVRVDVFEAYLATHPNQPFVKLVCNGFREGFWPWAETPKPGYPTTNDESKQAPDDVKKAEFLRAQRDIELAKECFSLHSLMVCSLECTACLYMRCLNPTRQPFDSSQIKAMGNICQTAW